MSKRRKFLFFLLPVIFFIFLIVLFLLIQTPFFINGLGSVLSTKLGYKINVQGISVSPGLEGKISGLSIERVKDGGLSFHSPQVDFDGKIGKSLKGEIENITLTHSRLLFRLEKKKKLDLSFIKKLPPVHLLTVQDGEFELSFDSSPQIIKMTHINLQLRNFSPQKGGVLNFRGLLKMLSNGSEGVEGVGRVEGNINLVSLFPKPSGKGFIEFHIDSGSYRSASFQNMVVRLPILLDKEKIEIDSASLVLDSLINRRDGKDTTLKDLKFQTSLFYDMKSNSISSGILDGKISNMGSFIGSFQGTLHDSFPWKASLKTSSINFGDVFSLFKPFLEPEYQKWVIKGKGIMETHFEGQRLSWKGDMILDFKEGEFSSPDGTKAGQGITGKVILKINSSGNKKAQFDLSSEVGGGELLWGKYYKDFSGERVTILSQGNFFLSSPRILDFQSSFDLFRTGNYSLSGSVQRGESILHLKAEKVSHSRMLSLFQEYLSQNIPSMKNLLLEGDSYLDVKTLIRRKGLSFDGILEIHNASLKIPEKSFSVDQLNVMLPFDLFYPSAPESALKETKRGQAGFIKIGLLEKGDVKIENMTIPLILSGNTFAIPEDIKISLFGGEITVKKFAGEKILFPSRRFLFGLNVKGLDIGSVSRDMIGEDMPGMLQADFPAITYQGGAWSVQGKAVVNVFGGVVEATNITATDLFSHSRKLGGDLSFEGISLEKVTEKIKIGKMTGIIRGSLRNLEIEYGQPSHFVLDIESVKTDGIKQKISVNAIQNISIVGTGSAGMASILSGGIRRFFKEYPYSKIGMQCSLENDNFSIRGKIHEGGKEYLVRRGFLRGVDVINANPQNVISFKDMQERIRRISKTE